MVGAGGMILHQVQKLGGSGNAVEKIETDVNAAVEKGKDKLDQVKDQVQKKL